MNHINIKKICLKISENKTYWSILFLSIVLLTLGLENITLRSVDGAVYASIARDLTEKPISQWGYMT